MNIHQKSIHCFFETLRDSKRVLIGTHVNPDGDAIGSALAVSLYLDSIGVDNEILSHHPVPHNLRFLPNVESIRHEPSSNEFDTGVVVDINDFHRLGNTERYFQNIDRIFIVDHHVPPQEAPSGIALVDSTMPATALILAKIMLDQGTKISPDIATCLLTGIFTDTGGFRYPSTTPEALEISSQLVTLGGNLHIVAEKVYLTRSLESLKLLGKAIQLIKTAHHGQIVWTLLSQETFQEVGATDEHSEGIVSEILTVNTAKVAAILRETKPSVIRISLRSRGPQDVSKIANQFGGGGHKNASGCTLYTSIEEAEATIVGALKACLESYS